MSKANDDAVANAGLNETLTAAGTGSLAPIDAATASG